MTLQNPVDALRALAMGVKRLAEEVQSDTTSIDVQRDAQTQRYAATSPFLEATCVTNDRQFNISVWQYWLTITSAARGGLMHARCRVQG